MDKFVIITPGRNDAWTPGVVRLLPDTYNRVAALHDKTGVSMCRIVSQAIDFALDHMDTGNDREEK